ncbi:MAG: mechanosensitive ion channel family protein [Campylobacterota bacterium]
MESFSSIVMQWIVNIALAALIFFIGKMVARKLADIVVGLMRKSKMDDTLIGFLESVLYGIMLVFIALAALAQLGIETTSFIAVLGAAGLAVGLAFKDSLSNVGSGMMIIILKPFGVGDYVTAGGESGTIEKITIFQTFMTTPDNKSIVVPNASITSDTITNYSAKETRRVDFVFGIGYDDDLKKAKEVLQEVISGDERVLQEPEPMVVVGELGDSSVNFYVRGWVKSADYWGLKWDLTELVKLRFDQEGISIPFPQMDLHMKQE